MSTSTIRVRIAAVESKLRCDDKLMVKVLNALLEGSTYAGSSNATPEGVETLERLLDTFEAQKMQHMEEKNALEREQRSLSQPAAVDLGGGAPVATADGGAPVATADGGVPVTTTPASAAAVALVAAPATPTPPVYETHVGDDARYHNDAPTARANSEAMSLVSPAAVVAASAPSQPLQSAAGEEAAAGAMASSRNDDAAASAGAGTTSSASSAVVVASSAQPQAVPAAVASGGILQSAQGAAVTFSARPATSSSTISPGGGQSSQNGEAAASASTGTTSFASPAAVEAASRPSQADKSARVFQSAQDVAAAALAGTLTTSSPAASAPSQAMQLAAAAAGVLQSVQDGAAGPLTGAREMSVVPQVVAAAPPAPSQVEKSAATVASVAGVVPSAQDGAVAPSGGAEGTSFAPAAADVATPAQPQAVQSAAAAVTGTEAAAAVVQAAQDDSASLRTRVVTSLSPAAGVGRTTETELPPPAAAAATGGGSAGHSVVRKANGGDGYRTRGGEIRSKDRSVRGIAAAVPAIAGSPVAAENNSSKTAPHYDAAALKAAKAAAAEAKALAAAKVAQPTAGSRSAPKPSTLVASSGSSLRAASPLRFAAIPSSPAGGEGVSPGLTSPSAASPVFAEWEATGATAAGNDDSSAGSAVTPEGKGKGKARDRHLGPGSVTASKGEGKATDSHQGLGSGTPSKGKGKASDSHAPTPPSSQAAADVNSAAPAAATSAAKRRRQEQPAHSPSAAGKLGGSSSGDIIQNPRATRANSKKARGSESNPLDRELCRTAWMPFHHMVVAAAMLYGTPEQKKVVTEQLNKLATADAQVSGKNAAHLAADLAAKLASTARKETKGELKTNDPEGPRHTETAVFVGRLKITDVCAGDAILRRYLLDDVEQLIADGYDLSTRIDSGFKALVLKSSTTVPTVGCQLEGWNDDDGTCVFKWKGESIS